MFLPLHFLVLPPPLFHLFMTSCFLSMFSVFFSFFLPIPLLPLSFTNSPFLSSLFSPLFPSPSPPSPYRFSLSSPPLSSSLLYRTNDSGLLTHKETLPVRSLVLGDIQRPGSEAAYRVGPLRCHGDSKSIPAAGFRDIEDAFF